MDFNHYDRVLELAELDKGFENQLKKVDLFETLSSLPNSLFSILQANQHSKIQLLDFNKATKDLLKIINMKMKSVRNSKSKSILKSRIELFCYNMVEYLDSHFPTLVTPAKQEIRTGLGEYAEEPTIDAGDLRIHTQKFSGNQKGGPDPIRLSSGMRSKNNKTPRKMVFEVHMQQDQIRKLNECCRTEYGLTSNIAHLANFLSDDTKKQRPIPVTKLTLERVVYLLWALHKCQCIVVHIGGFWSAAKTMIFDKENEVLEEIIRKIPTTIRAKEKGKPTGIHIQTRKMLEEAGIKVDNLATKI